MNKLGILQINGADYSEDEYYDDPVIGEKYEIKPTLSSQHREITTANLVTNFYAFYSLLGVKNDEYMYDNLSCSYDFKFIRDQLKALCVNSGAALSLSTEVSSLNISPIAGNKHKIGVSAIGDFLNKDGLIATYSGTDWNFQSEMDEGVDLLDDTAKQICCEAKIGSQLKRNSIIGATAAKDAGLVYDKNMYGVRVNRFALVKGLIHSELPDNVTELLNDTGTDGKDVNSYIDMYIKLGREGVGQGDGYGITDYITDKLRSKSWLPLTVGTIGALADIAEDLLLNGTQ